MRYPIDLSGLRFGSWTALSYTGNDKWQSAMWLCRCDCGVERQVAGKSLRSGRSLSCGCMKGELISKAKTTHGHSGGYIRMSPEITSESSTHGGSRRVKIDWSRRPRIRDNLRESATYKRWISMKRRVLDKSPQVFQYYGAKGIKVCERWLTSYENFLADMGECPEGLTLDRLDPDKDYSPENCRWATWKQQHRQRTMLTTCPICGELRKCVGA